MPLAIRRNPLILALLPAGVGMGHALGHGLGTAHEGAQAAHGYFPAALGAASALAVAASLGAAWAGARLAGRSPRREPGVAVLAAAQAGAFAALEMGETLVAGGSAGAVVATSAVWLGLAAQVVTAALVLGLLHAAGHAGRRMLAVVDRRPLGRGSAPRPGRPGTEAVPLAPALVGPCGPRGPPEGTRGR